MRITLLWPIGDYGPGACLDVDPRLGEVLCRESFARPSGDPIPAQRRNPTVAELQAYAAERGLSIAEAKRAYLEGAQ